MFTLKKILLSLYRIEDQLKAIFRVLKSIKDNSANGASPEDSTENTASALMQEGIDNIMGYQWPPKRGDNG